jgi:hypothetical protein
MRLRRFTVPAGVAKTRHRIGPDLANLLVAEGLPYVGQGADRLFDDYDLGNIALHLGLPSVRSRTMRSWANGLRRSKTVDRNEFRVGVVTQCPVSPHQGPCTYQLLRQGGGRDVRMAGPDPSTPIAHYDVQLASDWPALDPAASALVDETADLDFFLLPEAIRWDGDFMSRTRLADCGGVADWLVREGTRRGLPVRFSFGLLVVKPYSTPHCWAEFLTDGVWVPQDPLLLAAMQSWAGLAAAETFPHRSIGAVLYRLCGHFTKVASHNGIWAPLSLPTDYE